MSKTVQQERVETVVSNIMSGNNNCSALSKAVQAGDKEYFRRCVRPVVDAYEVEAAGLREQRQAALNQAETFRRSLEFVAQNMGGSVQITDPAIIQTMSAALDRAL